MALRLFIESVYRALVKLKLRKHLWAYLRHWQQGGSFDANDVQSILLTRVIEKVVEYRLTGRFSVSPGAFDPICPF